MKLKYLLPVTVLVLAVSAGAVYARSTAASNSGNASTHNVSTASSHASVTSTNGSNASSAKGAGTSHSGKGLQTACIKIASSVKNRDKKLYELSNNIINRFSTVVSRVQSYYNNTLLPKGVVVSNYATLSTAVLTAQDTAQGQLNQFSLDSGNFSCNNSAPQTQILAFNTDMKTEITDLNLYKKAVINLLVAVRSSTGSTNKTSNKSTLSTTK
jgi:hypothetical protein